MRFLKQFLDDVLAPAAGEAPAAQEHALQLAVAVLLVEVMRADAQIGPAERAATVAALREKFALSDEEIADLVERAELAARDAHDFQTFTSRLNDRFSMDQKVRMVELMWRVAYADGTLAAHEQHVMWRLADLLHVPHGAYISAKMRARDDAGAA